MTLDDVDLLEILKVNREDQDNIQWIGPSTNHFKSKAVWCPHAVVGRSMDDQTVA